MGYVHPFSWAPQLDTSKWKTQIQSYDSDKHIVQERRVISSDVELRGGIAEKVVAELSLDGQGDATPGKQGGGRGGDGD